MDTCIGLLAYEIMLRICAKHGHQYMLFRFYDQTYFGNVQFFMSYGIFFFAVLGQVQGKLNDNLYELC